MSTEHADVDADVAPQTVEEIIADLRASGAEVPEDPTHDLAQANLGRVDFRASVPHADLEVSAPDDLELAPWVTAWITPDYSGRGGGVSLTISAEDDDRRHRVSSCAELTASEARDLALQLLASAAVVDDSTEGPEGYLAE